MLRLGLTGGIASGKSAVAAMLREMGFAVLGCRFPGSSAHRAGQSGLRRGPQEFRTAVLAPGGRVDRAKTQRYRFQRSCQVDRLNAIVHPASPKSSSVNSPNGSGPAHATPPFWKPLLLIESGIHKNLDGSGGLPGASLKQQLERLVARALAKPKLAAAFAAQLPVAEKLRLATEKIDCSGSLEQTRLQSRLSPANSVALRRRGDPFPDFPYNGGVFEWISEGTTPMTAPKHLSPRPASFLPRWFFLLGAFWAGAHSVPVKPTQVEALPLGGSGTPMSISQRDAALTEEKPSTCAFTARCPRQWPTF